MKSVLILLVVFFCVRALKKHLEGRSAQKAAPVPPPTPPKEQPGAPRQKAEEMALDPVCGSYVPLSAAIKSTIGGKTVFFCSDDCREKFAP